MANDHEHATPTAEAVELHADFVAHLIHFGFGDGSHFAIRCDYDGRSGGRGRHWLENWCPEHDMRRCVNSSIALAEFSIVDGQFRWELSLSLPCKDDDGCGRLWGTAGAIDRLGIKPADLDVAPAFAEAVAERLVIERNATFDMETVRYECQGCSRKRHRRARSGYFDARFGVYRCVRCEWPIGECGGFQRGDADEDDYLAMMASDYNERTVFGSARHLARHQQLDEPALAEAFLAALARRRAERAAKAA